MSETLILGVLSALGAGGLGAALVALFKDRKKDNATAKLTDVEALQKQLVLLTEITKFLRTENDQLRKDYETSEQSRRKMRVDMEELEAELREVQRKCDRAIEQLSEMRKGQDA